MIERLTTYICDWCKQNYKPKLDISSFILISLQGQPGTSFNICDQCVDSIMKRLKE